MNRSETQKELSITEKIRADEMHFLVRDMLTDFKRSIEISFRRALIAVVNKEVMTGIYLSDIEDKIIESAENGTINGEIQDIMTNNRLIDWNQTIAQLMSKRKLNTSLIIIQTEISQNNPYYITTTSLINASVKDPIIEASYQKQYNATSNIPIEGIEDPYFTIESIGYSKNYIKECDFIKGNESSKDYLNGWCYKPTETNLQNVSEKDKKILCVNTINTLSNYDGFKAIITKDNSITTGAYIHNADIDLLENNTQIIIYNETIYITNITKGQTNNSCYYPDPQAPSFLNRLKGENQESEQGIASLINIPSLPPELRRGNEEYRIDYLYFKEI